MLSYLVLIRPQSVLILAILDAEEVREGMGHSLSRGKLKEGEALSHTRAQPAVINSNLECMRQHAGYSQ